MIEIPHLEEFLQNTIAVKNEIEQNPELIEEIRGSLNEWARAYLYKTLISNKYGLKKRHDTLGKIEATVTADLYKPDLQISHFCLILENGSDVAYLTKDFSGIDQRICEAGINEKEALAFPPISNAVDYMIRRGYGTPWAYDTDDLKNPKIIEKYKNIDWNYWMNLFMFSPETKEWAMHDLECNALMNFDEIVAGVENKEGRFSRLHDIWEVLSSDEYRLDLNGGEKNAN